jgi:hypothetical protein
VARKARAADQDKNLRSASTTMPGPKQPSRSAASGCSASVYLAPGTGTAKRGLIDDGIGVRCAEIGELTEDVGPNDRRALVDRSVGLQ